MGGSSGSASHTGVSSSGGFGRMGGMGLGGGFGRNDGEDELERHLREQQVDYLFSVTWNMLT